MYFSTAKKTDEKTTFSRQNVIRAKLKVICMQNSMQIVWSVYRSFCGYRYESYLFRTIKLILTICIRTNLHCRLQTSYTSASSENNGCWNAFLHLIRHFLARNWFSPPFAAFCLQQLHVFMLLCSSARFSSLTFIHLFSRCHCWMWGDPCGEKSE